MFSPGEPSPPMTGSTGGLNASARPVMVSGVVSVDEIAATCPGVSAIPGSDSDRRDLTELSDSDPSSEAVRTFPRPSPDTSASIRRY